ncbi:unknown protein [Seminavis robusta]|uniref:Uncharacterized protein n=1 Tax=Seminavis robusta TaxID=568900 RepID=A0A9N8ENM3_9STRA|nr:unknown protein [Seminavis robusta]|eukprot:Sro1238_g255250.1 n/a (184) ;mRNA; r:21182-21937
MLKPSRSSVSTCIASPFLLSMGGTDRSLQRQEQEGARGGALGAGPIDSHASSAEGQTLVVRIRASGDTEDTVLRIKAVAKNDQKDGGEEGQAVTAARRTSKMTAARRSQQALQTLCILHRPGEASSSDSGSEMMMRLWKCLTRPRKIDAVDLTNVDTTDDDEEDEDSDDEEDEDSDEDDSNSK